MGILTNLARNGGSFAPAGTPTELSLTEMASSLSVVINEAVSGFESDEMANKNLLLEAVCSVDTTENELMALTESIIGTVKEKVKAVWDRIIAFIKQIIDKITQSINALRMSGAALVSKYKSKVMGKDYKDFSFEGYIFEANLAAKYPMANFHIDGWLEKKGVELPNKFKDAIDPSASEDAFKAKEEEFEKKLTTLKDTSSEVTQLKVEFFNKLTGLDASSTSKFAELLFKDLRGQKSEKKEIKGFKEISLESVVKTLENPDDLTAMKNEYEKLKDSVEKMKDECVKIVENLNKDDASNTQVARANKLKSDYTSTWSNLVVSMLSVAADVNNAKVRAAEDKANQARMIFVKALKYNPKKPVNNSFEEDEYAELDYEV